MTTSNIAAGLITAQAIDSLGACNSLRKFHDVTQTLIKNQQLGLDFAPKRNNAFALPVALLVCYMSDSRRESLDPDQIRSFANAYKAGDHVDPMTVVPESGKLRVVTGITRYAGLMLAISEGCTIKQVWVMETDADPASIIIRQLNSNRQVAMKPVELGNSYRELIELKMTVPEIATRLHVKESHVRTMLDFDRVPAEVKQMVVAGQVSVKRAINEDLKCQMKGADTVVHMQNQLAKARENGHKKITPKNTSAPSPLFSRKDLDASVPVLLTLADALEKELPMMGDTPGEVTLQLKLGGDLQALFTALANLRNAHRTATGDSLPAVATN